MALQEVVFRQLENNCEEDEKLPNHLIIDVLAELFNLWPIFLYNLWMWPRVLWNEFGDIVDFSILHFQLAIISQ